jgi:hypothetical protein
LINTLTNIGGVYMTKPSWFYKEHIYFIAKKFLCVWTTIQCSQHSSDTIIDVRYQTHKTSFWTLAFTSHPKIKREWTRKNKTARNLHQSLLLSMMDRTTHISFDTKSQSRKSFSVDDDDDDEYVSIFLLGNDKFII